jgi:hypothetical protein
VGSGTDREVGSDIADLCFLLYTHTFNVKLTLPLRSCGAERWCMYTWRSTYVTVN